MEACKVVFRYPQMRPHTLKSGYCLWQVVEMFKAADKYDCPGLMKECVQTFRQTTEVPDIASLLQVMIRKFVLFLIVRSGISENCWRFKRELFVMPGLCVDMQLDSKNVLWRKDS